MGQVYHPITNTCLLGKCRVCNMLRSGEIKRDDGTRQSELKDFEGNA